MLTAVQPPKQQFYRVPTIAKMLDISKGSVWGMIKAGKLRAIKLGPNTTACDAEEVDAYIEKIKNGQP